MAVAMAMNSVSLNWVPPSFTKKANYVTNSTELGPPSAFSSLNSLTYTKETISNEENNCKRRLLLLGVGAITANLLPANSLLAEGNEFDFRGHDSAFKDRFLQLQNVRVRFIPTDKQDIHELGPIEEVVYNLVNHVYAAPNQMVNILDMQKRTSDGKNYYTFEYELTSPNYASASFATIAIGNGKFYLPGFFISVKFSHGLVFLLLTGRYYTLVVGALERRWRRLRNKLKVVADSFKVLDI
ncbi:hypothetical protein Gotur_032538 [Gossypium turneri]